MVCRPHNKPHGVHNLQGSRPDFTAGLLKDSSFQSDFMPDETDDRIKLQSTDKLVSSHCRHSEFGRWAVKANEITQDIHIRDFTILFDLSVSLFTCVLRCLWSANLALAYMQCVLISAMCFWNAAEKSEEMSQCNCTTGWQAAKHHVA